MLLAKSGGDTEKQVYFVQPNSTVKQYGSRGEGEPPDLALRFDLTVPLARFVAEHEHQIVFPFRRYQMQRVYRGESAQRGRFHEFYQCDIDVIGKDALSLAYDAEIPCVVADIFRELDIGAFTISLNNRKLLSGLLASFGIADPGQQTLVLREIDKLDKRGRDAVTSTLTAAPFSLARSDLSALLDLLSTDAPPDTLLDTLAAKAEPESRLAQGVAELREVIAGMRAYGLPDACYRIDLSIARGLDYYTGTVYETRLNDHPQLGSICSGGRYDDLAGYYTKSRLPGVGISIGLTRLFDQLLANGLVKISGSMVDVSVLNLGAEHRGDCLRIAAACRRAGLSVQMQYEEGSIKRQLTLAARMGARLCLIYGGREAINGVVAVKNMMTGVQTTVAIKGLESQICGLLNAPPAPDRAEVSRG
jgi:histidyl-tRNA synthetase